MGGIRRDIYRDERDPLHGWIQFGRRCSNIFQIKRFPTILAKRVDVQNSMAEVCMSIELMLLAQPKEHEAVQNETMAGIQGRKYT